MNKTFGMPAFFCNNWVIPAMQVRCFRIDPTKNQIYIYVDDGGDHLTSCKCDQLRFGFFPNEPPAGEEKKDESCIIKPV